MPSDDGIASLEEFLVSKDEEGKKKDDKEGEWKMWIVTQILVVLQHFSEFAQQYQKETTRAKQSKKKAKKNKKTKNEASPLHNISPSLIPRFFVTNDDIISAALNIFVLLLLELQNMGYIHSGRTRKDGQPMITKGEEGGELWLVSAKEMEEATKAKAKLRREGTRRRRGVQKIEGFGRRKMKQMHEKT